MKNIIYVFLICLIHSIAINAQSGNNDSIQGHLTFMGIPITGKISDFENILLKKGFSIKEGLHDKTVILIGKFSGENCEVCLVCSPKTKTVWKVAVWINKQDDWSTLKYKYLYYKEQLSTKYGQPDSYEYFTSPYDNGGEVGYELSALKLGKCHFLSFYTIENKGGITLEISKYSEVHISYEDFISTKIRDLEKDSQTQSDL